MYALRMHRDFENFGEEIENVYGEKRGERMRVGILFSGEREELGSRVSEGRAGEEENKGSFDFLNKSFNETSPFRNVTDKFPFVPRAKYFAQ